jgi:AraC-like DNA-binding protein
MAFNGRFVMNIAQFAANLGGNMQVLISLSGKTAQELCDEACVLEDKTYNAVIEQALKTTGDPFFGLHAGENLNLSAAGLIGQLTQTSETVKQALDLCCEFANLGCSALPMQLIEEEEHYKVTLLPDDLWQSQSPQAVQHTAEGVIAFTIKEFHALTRMQHNPLSIHLPWPQPAHISEYARVYGCPTYFNTNEIAIFLKKEHVEDRVITADYDLLRLLIAHAEEKSLLLTKELGFAALVKQSVLKLVRPEFPTIEQVSAHLNISPRTLQRRLKEDGMTYKLLIDGLRKEFAMRYLKNRDLTISEIAYLLSYADNSAFTRSFKRWTGKTPNAYRSLD